MKPYRSLEINLVVICIVLLSLQPVSSNADNDKTRLNSEELTSQARGFYRNGDFDKAKDLYIEATQLDEKNYGLSHPIVGQDYNDLAVIFQGLRQYEIAKDYMLKAIAIDEKSLSSDSAELAFRYYNLGSLYGLLKQYDKAEPYLNKALINSEKQLGIEHGQVGIIYNSLGMIYQQTGQYDKAELSFLRAITIAEKTASPGLADSYNNLGNLYVQQNLYEKADPFLRKSLSIVFKRLGKNHPTTRYFMGNYVKILNDQGISTDSIVEEYDALP